MERMLTWMLAPAVHGIPVGLACTLDPCVTGSAALVLALLDSCTLTP